jgi:6-pyruvoyltetrahydropterin/6-carboxytetrahydropterin synthase
MAVYLLEEVCPPLLAGSGVTATKVVIWETDESFAEATLTPADPAAFNVADWESAFE